MVDLLALIQSLVEIVLALGVRPQHVPIMAICRHEAIDLEDEAHQLGLTLQHLVVDGGLAHLRIGVRCSSRAHSLLLGEECLVIDQCIYALDKIFVALGHLLNRASTVVFWNRFHVQHLQEFEPDEVVIGVLVFLGDGVGDQGLDLGGLAVEHLDRLFT